MAAVRCAGSATRLNRRRQGSEAIYLLLLDWILPDGSGMDVITAIRSSPNARLPVIFLSARDSEDDIVREPSSDADDYVVKPPKQRVLIARVNAVLRRHAIDVDAGETLDLEPYSIDAKRRRISAGGQGHWADPA